MAVPGSILLPADGIYAGTFETDAAPAGLHTVLGRYRQLVTDLLAEDTTFIHGEFYPANGPITILAGPGGQHDDRHILARHQIVDDELQARERRGAGVERMAAVVLGEGVDAVLADGQPVRDSDFRADPAADLVDRLADVEPDLPPPTMQSFPSFPRIVSMPELPSTRCGWFVSVTRALRLLPVVLAVHSASGFSGVCEYTFTT